MIKSISIENYKSIQKLKFYLGRITVFIGANGSGKSNILEAFTLCSAAANDKLDNEFLYSRGLRVSSDPKFMRAAFSEENVSKEIKITVEGEDTKIETLLQKNNDLPYSSWFDNGRNVIDKALFFAEISKEEIEHKATLDNNFKLSKAQKKVLRELFKDESFLEKLYTEVSKLRSYPLHLNKFLIYSPELSALRTFEQEGQIEPLGIKGEGLFKLLRVMYQSKSSNNLDELKSKLRLIEWFDDFELPKDLASEEKRLDIRDKFIDSTLGFFDQGSTNEGFLFLLFYFCLFINEDTPKFFAVDNIDAALNPKLCTKLMIELNNLAVKYKKQAIFTAHNPAILDGLNLDDEQQKIYIVSRNKLGQTTVKPVHKPKPIEGQKTLKLSEAFLRGNIGGLPKNF